MGKTSKLVLFDIDGTLIKPVSLGVTLRILKRYFGCDKMPAIYMEGKTHSLILFECMKDMGIAHPLKDPRFKRALDDYGPGLMRATRKGEIEKVPNVEVVVKRLLKKGVTVGVLTGNTKDAARVKLLRSGLLKYFKFGAYGDRIRDRNKLVPVALKEARRATGISFEKRNVFIVGDTVRDIGCAKANGVVSIAVSTGKETLSMLRRKRPTHLFKDFSNVDAFMRAIG